MDHPQAGLESHSIMGIAYGQIAVRLALALVVKISLPNQGGHQIKLGGGCARSSVDRAIAF